MDAQVVFSCDAKVFKYDGHSNGYRALLNEPCHMRLISTEQFPGFRTMQMLQILTPQSYKLILEIDFNGEVALQQSRDMSQNILMIKTSHGTECYMFVTVGEVGKVLGFSQWLCKFTNTKGMSAQPQEFYPSTHHMQRMSMPILPQSAFNQADQLRASDMRASNMIPGIPYPQQQGELQQPFFNLRNDRHPSYHQRTFFDGFREKPEDITLEKVSSSPVIPSVEFNDYKEQRISHNLPPRLKSPVGAKPSEEVCFVNTQASGSELTLNAVNTIPVSTEPVRGKESPIKGDVVESQKVSQSTGDVLKEESTENLCRMLVDAIKDGSEEKSSKLAVILAKRKPKLAIPEINDEVENKGVETSIKVTVHVEHKQCKSPTLIKLDVDPNKTDIFALKKLMHRRYRFPSKAQRWIIGKRLPKDSETLKSLDVKTTGTVIFLYLLSVKDAGLGMECIPAVEDRSSDKAPSLPPRDFQPDGLAGVPPLNARFHKYATVPINSQKELDSQHNPARLPFPQQERSIDAVEDFVIENEKMPAAQFADNPHATLPNMDGLGADRAHPHPQPIFKRQNQGWTCPFCTFVNIPTRPGCEVCCNSRPVDYKMPPNFEIDEGERQRLENEALQDQLAHNYEEEVKEMERMTALENFQQTLQVAQMALVPNTEPFDCPICFDEIGINEGVVLRECLHKICRPCLQGHIKNSEDPEVPCPIVDDGVNCMEVITAQEIQAVLPEEDHTKYLQLSVNAAETRAVNSFHCKTVNCRGWCYYEDEVNWFFCDVCKKRNCLTCKAIHDDMTCQEYQDDLKRRADSEVAAKKTQEMLEGLIKKGDAMKCPQCSVILQKKDGCDWMRCSMCRTEICWATKGRRWGPQGKGDISGGCKCSPAKRCHPNCGNCH